MEVPGAIRLLLRMIRAEIEAVGAAVVDAAVQIHREIGAGLLESVYKILLAQELVRRGFFIEIEKPICLTLRGTKFQKVFVADLIVNGCVIIEVKSVEKMHPVFHTQLLTYLRLTNIKLGYLLNFKTPLMKAGITRVVNKL